MSGFDYPWTCPKIDKQIAQAKREIKDFLFDFIEELCPKIPYNAMHELASGKTDELYRAIESCFEEVRRLNEGIRDAAEKQIKEKEQEVSDLQKEIERLEGEL